MPRKGQSTPKPPIGDVRDPNSLYHHMQRFLQAQALRSAACTVSRQEERLRDFVIWCDERSLGRPHDITRPIMERYQRHLFLYRKADGAPLTVRTQYNALTSLRLWFRWLARNSHILYNPASDLDMPRIVQRLPKHTLTVAEVETVLALPDLNTSLGLRDRAILETFYSTGMRRLELVNLGVYDLDASRGTVMIREGKGGKDRVAPIGERAMGWIDKYLHDVRPELACGKDEGRLFLTHTGEVFTPGRMTDLARHYIDAAKLGKRGSCHLFRHTMATLMLENGADIRFIQAILGHADISTTQIYTQVSIRAIKDIHTATHPGRVIAARPGEADHLTRDALLAALNQESDDEDE